MIEQFVFPANVINCLCACPRLNSLYRLFHLICALNVVSSVSDPTSSFVTSEQQQVLTSRTSGLEEDTSGISGISPLDDPSSMDPMVAMSGGIGGGEDVELADSQEWRKLKISFEPPTSTADRDVRGEQSFAL